MQGYHVLRPESVSEDTGSWDGDEGHRPEPLERFEILKMIYKQNILGSIFNYSGKKIKQNFKKN